MDKIKIIDSHTHIQDKRFNKDIEDVICRALENNIGMIVAGTDVDTTQEGIKIAEAHNFVWATAGLHPHEALRSSILDIEKISKLSKNDMVVGIGECGLDYSLIPEEDEKNKQKEFFIEHIAISKEANKPLIIHCRNSRNNNEDAFADILSIIKKYGNVDREDLGVCHFFTGSKSIAKSFLDLGFSFTFGGLITKTHEFDDVIKYIPKRSILLETDAPFVSPSKYKNKRNEPFFIIETIKSIAQILKTNIENVEKITKNNTDRVFHLNQNEN